MAKKYILEPTELEFKKRPNSTLGASLRDTTLYGLTMDELKNLIPDGAIVDINNGDKFITASDNEGIVVTRDGAIPEMPPEEYAEFVIDGEPKTLYDFYIVSTVTTSPGTYTVSIYTETEDVEPEASDPYPVKNFTYEHAEVAKNDIEDIIQAIYTYLGETESHESHGYSPADRLVIAVAKLHNVNPETALTTGNYPNQMKRIAAIIRGEFSSGETGEIH